MAKIELDLDNDLSQFVGNLGAAGNGQRDKRLNTILGDYVEAELLKDELREIYEQLGDVLNMPSSRKASRGKLFWNSYTRSLANRLTLALETDAGDSE